MRFIAQHQARRRGPEYKVEANTGCWLWLGGRIQQGYGLKRLGPGKHQIAHRYMYEKVVGPIPEGLILHHTCNTPRCVNPEHLRPVTHAENIQAGRSSKLTADDVREIRRLAAAGTNRQLLAERYGINSRYIYRVLRGSAWSDVT